MGAPEIFEQHVIDPEICIRCNTCEATCPVGAVTHDDRNYVVDADKCNHCMACVPPCPTGSIDNWRTMQRSKVYTLEQQFSWDELPTQVSLEATAGEAQEAAVSPAVLSEAVASESGDTQGADQAPSVLATSFGSAQPPWSAAHPYTNLYGAKAAQKHAVATVTGNVRVTDVGKEYDTHHIVLDFGQDFFPVLEGQSIGVLPPGTDAKGRAHFARQYSVASPRDGERPGYNNLSLTVKRVLEDHNAKPVRGVASNFLCDLKVGDKVNVVGPFGASFLMPNHAGSHIVMICTGTGSAPMRAMTEWRRRQLGGKVVGGKLKLFFGARSAQELPYFGPLKSLPKEFIDIHLAFSRAQNQPKQYVQDLMLKDAAALLPLIKDSQAYFYVCGLKAMEQGVLSALEKICIDAGEHWPSLAAALKAQGRLHLETY
jgi:benzoyl-CoA 2,3-epoxidase subunit A